MASNRRIKGITIEIGGDTTKLDKALESTNKELNTTQKNLKDVERLLKIDPKNTELLAQKQRLLAQSVETTAKRLDTLRQAAANADEALKRGTDYKTVYEPLKQQLDTVSATMRGLEANAESMRQKLESGEISTEQYDVFTRKLESTRGEAEKLEKAIEDVNKEFAGAKIDQSQYDALQREIIDTENALKDLQDQADKSESSLQKLSDVAGRVSTGAGKIRDAFMPVTTAIAGVGTAALATVPATEDFRRDMSRLETNAQQAGVGIDATTAAFDKLRVMSGETDSSVEAVSNLLQAGFTESNLQMAVEGLANAATAFPDTVRIESLADSLQETLATGTATGQFAEVLDRLGIGAEAFSAGLAQCTTEADKQYYALDALVNGPLQGTYDAWAKANPELVASSEASMELQNSMARLAEELTPIVTMLANIASDFISWFSGLDDWAKAAITTFGLLLAAIGPVSGAISNISGMLSGLSSKDFSGVVTAAQNMGTAVGGVLSNIGTTASKVGGTIQSALGGALSFVASNPAVLVAAAIAGIIAGIVLLWNNCEAFRDAVTKIWEAIKDVFASFDEWLSGVFATDWTESFGALGEVFNAFFDSVENIWNGIKGIFTGIIDFITGVFSGDWQQAWEGIVGIFRGIFETIGAIVTTPINAVIGVINGLLDGVASAINAVVDLLNNISIDIPEWVPLIGGKSLGFNLSHVSAPQIPTLATGALVPPNNPFLAVLGDNKRETEIVAPYSTIKQAASEAIAERGGGSGMAVADIYLDGAKVGRGIFPYLENERVRVGARLVGGAGNGGIR